MRFLYYYYLYTTCRYPFLLENINVLIYNGDWDACVPYTDNEAWTAGMGLDVQTPWHTWSYHSIDDGSSQVCVCVCVCVCARACVHDKQLLSINVELLAS